MSVASSDPHTGLGPKGRGFPIPCQLCFLSHLFAMPRPDGRHLRLIIDLSRLNEYVVVPPFRLDIHATLACLRTPPTPRFPSFP